MRNIATGLFASYCQNHLTKCAWPRVRVSDPGSPGKNGFRKAAFLFKKPVVCQLTTELIQLNESPLFSVTGWAFTSHTLNSVTGSGHVKYQESPLVCKLHGNSAWKFISFYLLYSQLYIWMSSGHVLFTWKLSCIINDDHMGAFYLKNEALFRFCTLDLL